MSVSSTVRRLGTLLLGIALLLASWGLSLYAVPRPAVGIIRLDTDIWIGSVELVQAQIEAAREDRCIKAVVVQLDSPGGEVVATQTLYLELQDLRREMPVVGSIDSMAASGGFYAAMATEPIYAKPSSAIGNVGVWAYIPPELGVNDVILTSGPFKMTGSSREEFLREIEGIKQEFLATVFSQRGERPTLSAAELSQGLLYTGREAFELGLVDHIGSQSEAIATAAEQAGIANYEVIDLRARVLEERGESELPFFEPWAGAADPATGERTLPPGVYLLYDTRMRGMP